MDKLILAVMGYDFILNLTGSSLSFYNTNSVDFNNELNCYILKEEDTEPSTLGLIEIDVQFKVDELLQTLALGAENEVCIYEPKEIELPIEEEGNEDVPLIVTPEMVAYLGDIPNNVFIPGPEVRTHDFKFRGHIGLIQVK